MFKSRAQVAEPKGPGKLEFKVSLGYKARSVSKERAERRGKQGEGGRKRKGKELWMWLNVESAYRFPASR